MSAHQPCGWSDSAQREPELADGDQRFRIEWSPAAY